MRRFRWLMLAVWALLVTCDSLPKGCPSAPVERVRFRVEWTEEVNGVEKKTACTVYSVGSVWNRHAAEACGVPR